MRNTSNTFLRFFQNDKEVFISIADLEYSGSPINDDGDEFDNDELLYRYDQEKQEYVQIV